MSAPAVATPGFAGFRASVGVCLAILRRSWGLMSLSLVGWLVVVLESRPAYGDPARPPVGDWPIEEMGLSFCLAWATALGLRSQLLGPELYLPASARTRSLAIALVTTVVSTCSFAALAGLDVALGGPGVDPIPALLAIFTVGVGFGLLEVLDRAPVWARSVFALALTVALVTWAMPTVRTRTDLLRVLPFVGAGYIVLFGRLPPSWRVNFAPAFLRLGIRDTAFPAAPADPIQAIRALLAAERTRSLAWRLLPGAVAAASRWPSYALGVQHSPGADLIVGVGTTLFAIVPFILPISEFGMDAVPVAMTLPVSPLAVHHAAIREAAIRCAVQFGIFAVFEAVRFGIGRLTAIPVEVAHSITLMEVLIVYAWPVPMFALTLGAAAWVSYPSRLKVFLAKVAMIGVSIPAAMTVMFVSMPPHATVDDLSGAWLRVLALTTLLGLCALALGELRARRAWRPYREAA